MPRRPRPAQHDPETVRNPERDVFTEAMANVVPLPRDPRGRVRRVPVVHTPPAEASERTIEEADPESPDVAYVAPGVDRRELRRLRRGTYPPGRRLDLHGQSAAAAATRVEDFIRTARPRHRCVAIVHGRGLHSNGNVAVLRQRVRALLRAHPAVLAFADAPPGDGGDGAVYVLLRG